LSIGSKEKFSPRFVVDLVNGPAGTRTRNQRLKRALLYRLSYRPSGTSCLIYFEYRRKVTIIAPYRMKHFVVLFFALALSLNAADFDVAAKATNQLGVDLHRQLARGDENLCLSPYSVESALAMTFAGADRKSTRLNSSH